jgi:ribose/xylose/arabinose/galactoside ABC-type transport system permease subunit
MLQLQNLGKILVTLGALVVLLGALIYFMSKSPALSRILEPLRWQKGSVTVFFPLGLCLLLSVIITVILRFWRH